MATSLQTRLKQLDGGGANRCPECGFGGDWSKVRHVWEPGYAHDQNHHCGTCGRPTLIVLRWEDKP